MKRKLGSRGVALMTALAFAAPVVGMASAAAAYSFGTIRVEGNQRIEAETVMSHARIARGQQVSAGDLNDAVQRLQNSGLFETVEVVPQGGTLVIRVREYPTINVINFEGNRRIKDDELAKFIKSKSRHVYQPAQAIADASELAKLYAARGRLAARIDPVIIRRDGNRVDLVFQVKEGNVTEIERIGFAGNRAYSDRRLRDVLETKQAGILRTFIRSDTYAPERIAMDEQMLTDFYRSRGYVDMKVQGVAPEIARERDAFYITFNIQEGQQYRFGTVTTVSEIPGVDAAAYGAQNRVKRGAIYNPAVIDNTIRRMETVAIQQAQNFVAIEPRVTRNPDSRTLDLTFVLTRGPRMFVERIDIEGNSTTLDQVIRRQFRVVEGDPFNPREIRNAAERIRALGYFADAQVQSRQGSSAEQMIVDVNVEEQPTGSLSFGASYGADSGPGLNVSISERNFLGRGQELGLTISTTKGDRQASFNFVEPYVLGRDLKFRGGLWYTETDQQYAKYNTRTIGVSAGLEFPVSENGRLELRYKLAEDQISDVTAGSSVLLEEGALISSGVGYGYSYDTRRLGLDPLTAFKLSFGQDFNGLGGDVKTVVTSLSAGVESNAWREEITLRAEFEAGAVIGWGDEDTRIIDRHRGQKVRGFKPNGIGPRDLGADNQDALGGNYFWVARAEAQFPVGLPEEYGIQGGLFADVGSIWGLDNVNGTKGPVDDAMHLRAAVGASVYWTTPIGPLRFNFAKAVKKQDYDLERKFDLTISTKF